MLSGTRTQRIDRRRREKKKKKKTSDGPSISLGERDFTGADVPLTRFE